MDKQGRKQEEAMGGMSRREFLGRAAKTAAGVAGLALADEALAQVFPPPPPAVDPLKGVIDFHVHSAPDVFGRSLDDLDVARKAAEAGMGAIVLKNHVAETAARAYLARKEVPGIQVFGGVTLNNAVGGVNPAAVEWMLRMLGRYGKVVWLPTFEADHHVKYFKEATEGIRVVEGNRVLSKVEEVMRICARNDLVLETGHASAEEALLLIERARELGVQKVVVTHAIAAVVDMSLEQLQRAAELGAFLEVIYLTHLMGPTAHLDWMQHWKRTSIADYARAIKAIGAEHFILSTDLGSAGNPTPFDGYRALIAGLKKEGLQDDQIDLMAQKNPARLLGLG